MRIITILPIDTPPLAVVPAYTELKIIRVISWNGPLPNSVLFFAKGYRFVVLRIGEYAVVP